MLQSGAGADRARQLKPGHLRHSHVRDHGVENPRREQPQSNFAVPRGVHEKARRFQSALVQHSGGDRIIDHEDGVPPAFGGGLRKPGASFGGPDQMIGLENEHRVAIAEHGHPL